MLKKIKKKSGMSLSETLLATIIVSLVTLVVAAGMGTVLKVYRSTKTYSEARIIANSALKVIEDEMRYAKDLKIDNDVYTYTSKVYGKDTEFKISNGNIIINNSYKPLSDAFLKGYIIRPKDKKVEDTIDDDKITEIIDIRNSGYVTISFAVCDSSGNPLAEVKDVNIKLLNES